MESEAIKDQPGIREQAKDLVDHAGEYLDTLYKTQLLKVTGKAIKTGSSVIASVVIGVLSLLVVFFGSIALAWWLGDVVNSRTGGFLIMGGFYLLLLVVLLATKKTVMLPFIRNLLTRKIYEP